MKIMKRLMLVGLMIAVLFSLWACGGEVSTGTDTGNPNNPDDPNASGLPGSTFVQGDKIGVKQIGGDSWRLMYYELENGEETTLREFFDAYLTTGSTSETFESVGGDYTWTVDGVAADGSTPVKKGSNIVATDKEGVVKTPADGQMKLNVTIYHPTTGQQMGAGIVVDGSSITLKDLFETHISGGSQTFEDCLEEYTWYVDGKEATADTALNAQSVILAKMLTPADGGNSSGKPNPENPGNPENPDDPENPGTPGGFEQGDKIGVRSQVGDSFQVMYFEMDENELTLRAFFDTYIGRGSTTFDEQSEFYTWTVDGEPANGDTSVKRGSNVVGSQIGVTVTEPEEGQIKLPVTILNPENGRQQGTSIIVDGETIQLGTFFETYVSGGSQSFEDASEEYTWYVDGQLADANTVLSKDSEITAVYKDTGDTPVNPGPGTNKETIEFSFRFIDMNGEIIQSGHSTVTLYEGEIFTLADVAVHELRFESFTESLQYGYFEINGERVTDPSVQIANGDVITYTQTVDPDPNPGEDDTLMTPATDEVLLRLDNGSVISEQMFTIDAALPFGEFYEEYLASVLGDYESVVGMYTLTVDGNAVTSETVVSGGSVVRAVLNYSNPPVTPEAGEILITLTMFTEGTAVQRTGVVSAGTTLKEFYENYIGGASFEDSLLSYVWTVNGVAADANTVLTEGCEVVATFEVAVGVNTVTFVTMTSSGSSSSQTIAFREAELTLRQLFEGYFDPNGLIGWEEFLAYGSWLVNGEAADENTIVRNGDIVTFVMHAPEEFEITFRTEIGGESFEESITVDGSEITLYELFDEYLKSYFEYDYEELLTRGEWLVNGAAADADTVIAEGDTVSFVPASVNPDPDDPEPERIMVNATIIIGDDFEGACGYSIKSEEATVYFYFHRYLFDSYLEVQGTAIEDWEWYVDDVLVTDYSYPLYEGAQVTMRYIGDGDHDSDLVLRAEIYFNGEYYDSYLSYEPYDAIDLQTILSAYFADAADWEAFVAAYSVTVNGEENVGFDWSVYNGDIIHVTEHFTPGPEPEASFDILFTSDFENEELVNETITVLGEEITLQDLVNNYLYPYIGYYRYDESFQYGAWFINGEFALGNPTIQAGDTVRFAWTQDVSTSEGYNVHYVHDFHIVNDYSLYSDIWVEDLVITVKDFFERYVIPAYYSECYQGHTAFMNSNFETTLAYGYWTINEEEVDETAILKAGDVIRFHFTELSGLKIHYPNNGETWETLRQVAGSQITLQNLYNWYLKDDLFFYESLAESFEFGVWYINGVEATADDVICDNDLVAFELGSVTPDPGPDDPEPEYEITFETILNNNVLDSQSIYIAESVITLQELFETYISMDSEATFESTLESGAWLVNGEAADADTTVCADDVVSYVINSVVIPDDDATILTPEAGDVLVKVMLGDFIAEQLIAVGDSELTLEAFYNAYLLEDSGVSFEEAFQIYVFMVDGVAADANTVIREQSVILMAFAAQIAPEEPSEGEIKITMIQIDDSNAMSTAQIIPEGMTLRWFYEIYLEAGSFESTLLSTEWMVNGEFANADTVLTAGCVITATYRVAEGANEVFFGVDSGDGATTAPVVMGESEIALEVLFNLYLNADPDTSFEDTLADGYWTVNGELATSETVVMAGDTIIYVITFDTIELSVGINAGDSQMYWDIELDATEEWTVRGIYDAYLNTMMDAFENYEWYLNGELVDGDTVITGSYGMAYLEAVLIGAEVTEPEDGEIKVTLEIYQDPISMVESYIIPDTGMTLEEFFNAYIESEGTTFEETLEAYWWYVDGVPANASTVLTADAYIYAEYFESSTPDLDRFVVMISGSRGEEMYNNSFELFFSEAELRIFFKLYLQDTEFFRASSFNDWTWYVDGELVSDPSFVLYPGAVIEAIYNGEQGGDDPIVDCDHDRIETGVECPGCGMIVFLRYEIYLEGKHFYTYNFFDEFEALPINAVLSECMKEAEDWETFISQYSVAVNKEDVTEWDHLVYNGDMIFVEKRSAEGGDDTECDHDWDASTGSCYKCGIPCPGDHNENLGEDCPICGFNTNGGENSFYFLTFVVDGESFYHSIILPPVTELTLDMALLDFRGMDLMEINGSYDVYVDGELVRDGSWFVSSMATIELRPIGSSEGGDINPPEPVRFFEVYGIQYLAGESAEGGYDPYWWMKGWVAQHTLDREVTLRELLESYFCYYNAENFTIWVNGEIVTDVDSYIVSDTAYIVLLEKTIEFNGITLTIVDETTGDRQTLHYDRPMIFNEIRDELIGADFDWESKLYTIVANGYEDMMCGHFDALAVDVTITIKMQEHQVNIGIVDAENKLYEEEYTIYGTLPTFAEFVEQYLSGAVSGYRFFDLNGGEVRECAADEKIPEWYGVIIPADQIKNPITITYHVTTIDGEILEDRFTIENPAVLGYIFNSQEDRYFDFIENMESYLITVNGNPVSDKTGVWYVIIWGDCHVVVAPAYTFTPEYWGVGDFEVLEPVQVSDPNMTLRDVLALFNIDWNRYALNGDYDLDATIGERFNYGWNVIGISPRYVNFRIEFPSSDGSVHVEEVFERFIGSVTYEELLNFAREQGLFNPEEFALYIWNDNGEMVELTDLSYTWSVPEGESSVEYVLQIYSKNVQVEWEVHDRNDNWIRGDYLTVERGTTVAEIMEMIGLDGSELSRIYENWSGTDLAVSDELVGNVQIIFTQHSGMLWVTIRDDYGTTYFEDEIEISGNITAGEILSQYTEYTWDIVRYAYCNGEELSADSAITGTSLEITLNIFMVSINIYDANGMWVYGKEQPILGSITLGEFLEQYCEGYTWEDIDYGYSSSAEMPTADTEIMFDDKIELFLKAVPFTVTYEGVEYGPFEAPMDFNTFLMEHAGVDYWMESQYGYWQFAESGEQLWEGYPLNRDCVIVYVRYEGMGFNVNCDGKDIYVDQPSVTLYDLVNLYLGMDYYTSIQNGYWTVDGMQVDEYWMISGYCTVSYVSNGGMGGEIGFTVHYDGKEIMIDQPSITLYDLVSYYLGMDYYTSIQNGYWTVDYVQADETWMISGYCNISYVSYGDVGGGDDGCPHMFGPSGSCDLCGAPCPEDHNLYYGVEPCPTCGFVGDGGMMATEYFFSFYVDGVYQTQISRFMMPGEYVTLDDLLWEALGMSIDELMQTYEFWVNGENVIRYGYEIYGDAEIRLDMIMPSIYWITYNGSLYSVTPDMSLAMAISNFGYIYEELAPYGYFTVDGMMVDDPYNHYFTGDCTVEYVQTSQPECEHMWISAGYCELCKEPCPEDHSMLVLGESCRNCSWMINDGKYYIINVTIEDAGRTERLEYETDTLTLDTIAAELGINARDYIWYLASREIEYAEGKTLHDYSVYYYGDVELRLCERYVTFGYNVYNEFMESIYDYVNAEESGLKFHGSVTFGEILDYIRGIGVEDVYAYTWKFNVYDSDTGNLIEFYLDPATDTDHVFDSHDAGWEAYGRAVHYDFELIPKNSFGVILTVYNEYSEVVDEKRVIMYEAKLLPDFLRDNGYTYANCLKIDMYSYQYGYVEATEYTYVNQRYRITIYLAAEETTEEGAEAA